MTHSRRHRVLRGYGWLQMEPIESVGSQRDEIRLIGDCREARSAENFRRLRSYESLEVERCALREARQVGDDQKRSSSNWRMKASTLRLLGYRNSSVPRPKAWNCLRCWIRRLVNHSSECGLFCCASTLTGLVVILRIDDDRQIQPLRIGAREAGVAVGAPLHGRAHAVAVAEINVVAHPDLVAVINHRRARQREQQRVHQLDAAAIVLQQRRQPAANAEIDAHLAIARVDCDTCSRALRRSPFPASARRDCAGTSPTGSCRGSPGVCCKNVDDRDSDLPCAVAMNSRGITGK